MKCVLFCARYPKKKAGRCHRKSTEGNCHKESCHQRARSQDRHLLDESAVGGQPAALSHTPLTHEAADLGAASPASAAARSKFRREAAETLGPANTLGLSHDLGWSYALTNTTIPRNTVTASPVVRIPRRESHRQEGRRRRLPEKRSGEPRGRAARRGGGIQRPPERRDGRRATVAEPTPRTGAATRGRPPALPQGQPPERSK